jgi:hypothetical protein
VTVRVLARGVPRMDFGDIHFWGDAPPHGQSLSGASATSLLLADYRRWLRMLKHRSKRRRVATARAYRSELFAMSPIEALRSRSTDLRSLELGYAPRGLEALAAEAHCTAFFAPAVARWLDAAIGTPAWRVAGCGIARADTFADGTWDHCATHDIDGPKAGTAVLTMPAFDGPDIVELFALELAPQATQRRAGRVYLRTGHAVGLGTHSFEAREWRENSTRLALVAHPLDWLRRFAVAPETGACVPLLDGQPCAWIAGIDPAQGIVLDTHLQREAEDLLCAAVPVLADGSVDSDFPLFVQAALDRARRRRMPPKPEVLLWTPDDSSNVKEQAA